MSMKLQLNSLTEDLVHFVSTSKILGQCPGSEAYTTEAVLILETRVSSKLPQLAHPLRNCLILVV